MAKTPPKSEKTAPKAAPAPAVSTAPTPEKESNIERRLSIPLDKNGDILVENMREGTKNDLKGLFLDPKNAKKLGISPESAPGKSEALPAELMYPLVAGLSWLEVLAVKRFTDAPREVIDRVVPFSHEEVQLLAPKVGAVLDKYGAGNYLAKYKEEVDLAGWMIALTVRKITAIREELAKLGPRSVAVPLTGDFSPAKEMEPEA